MSRDFEHLSLRLLPVVAARGLARLLRGGVRVLRIQEAEHAHRGLDERRLRLGYRRDRQHCLLCVPQRHRRQGPKLRAHLGPDRRRRRVTEEDAWDARGAVDGGPEELADVADGVAHRVAADDRLRSHVHLRRGAANHEAVRELDDARAVGVRLERDAALHPFFVPEDDERVREEREQEAHRGAQVRRHHPRRRRRIGALERVGEEGAERRRRHLLPQACGQLRRGCQEVRQQRRHAAFCRHDIQRSDENEPRRRRVRLPDDAVVDGGSRPLVLLHRPLRVLRLGVRRVACGALLDALEQRSLLRRGGDRGGRR
mmetsp:Transcript_39613/g.122483  ORF Transcript_39613/g.122483 Transcript_39613/m.122483 type:complete len:314 (+) Transcript_39613:1337-2278(+)